jgi:hypothetical protein
MERRAGPACRLKHRSTVTNKTPESADGKTFMLAMSEFCVKQIWQNWPEVGIEA